MRSPLWLCLIGFAVVSLAVGYAVRLDYGPDEPDHLEYVHILAWQHRLPTPGETHVVQHPPVYYALMAGLWRVMGANQPPSETQPGPTALGRMEAHSRTARHVLRVVSTLLACLTLLVLARILGALGVPSAWQTLLLFLVAACPMFQYVSGVVNNENLSILYSSLICLAIVVRVRAQTCSRWQALGLGLLLGGGLLVKQTTLFALPLALWAVWQTGNPIRRLPRLGLFALGFLALGLAWPLHNHALSGQWFPCYTIPPDQAARASDALSHPLVFASWLRAILETGFLPDWSVLFVPRLLSTLAVLLLIGLIGVVFLAGLRRGEKADRQMRGLALAGMLLLLAGIVEFSLSTDYRAQIGGRYLLNGLPWLLAFFAASLPRRAEASETPPPPRWLAIPFILLALFDLGWWYIVQGYYTGPNFGTG